MDTILNHTQTYSFNWADALSTYQQNKKTLQWKYNPSPKFVTEKEYKQNDRIFHPILQTYTVKNTEDQLKHQEKDTLMKTICNNTDYQLRNEQTFNIINLKDKLQGLEEHADYPRHKSEQNRRKNLNFQKIDYNVLSNISLGRHHFLRPEDRPNTQQELQSHKPRMISLTNYKDYDIISNQYKENHVEKVTVENELNKIQTAKNFWRRNDYNPVQGKFYDNEKEDAFQLQRAESLKSWGKNHKKNLPPNSVRGNGDLYNPINMITKNNDELKLADLKVKNKKKRYDLRYDVEKYYHDKNLLAHEIKNEIKNKKISYLRFKEIDDRGYNVINLKNMTYKENTKNVKRDNVATWDKLINLAGDKNTFSSKPIYKDLYDYSEVGVNYQNYQNQRHENLLNLPNIDKDKAFANDENPRVKEKNSEGMNKNENAQSDHQDPLITLKMDKKLFFETQKSNFYHEGEVEKMQHDMYMKTVYLLYLKYF